MGALGDNWGASEWEYRASGWEPAPDRWLWRERIPEGVIVLLAGRPEVAKSLLTFLIAADVSQFGDVIISNREERIRQSIRPRLEAAGADLNRVHLWTPELLPKGQSDILGKIRKWDARLFMLDPAAAHLSVSIYNDQDVRRALTPLTKIAEGTGCSFVLPAHMIKAVSARAHPLAAVGGSGGGLVGAARVVYLMGPNPQDADERILACAKSSVHGERPRSLAFEIDRVEVEGAGEQPKLVLVGESDVDAQALVAGSAVGGAARPPEKRARAEEFLANYLRYGPRPQAEVREDATQHGIRPKTLRDAFEALGGVSKKRGFGKSGYWEWALPPELRRILEEGNGDGDE